MEHREIKPPHWAERFLGWYCKAELLEDLQGDLYEYFQRNIKAKGLRKAKLIYIIDVFKFMRFYTIRKPQLINSLLHWIMLGSYIKTSGRNLVRHKLFSTINVVGLAVSMTVGLLLIALLLDLHSYDRFHANYHRMYRVTSNYAYRGNVSDSWFASTSLRAGQLLGESVPGVESAAVFYSGADNDVRTADNVIIPLEGFWANDAFFSVFTFPLIEGNFKTALRDPFTMVITRESAEKLFGSTDVVGKTVTLADKADQPYAITGVMENIPVFSHFKFDMLISLSTRPIIAKENQDIDKSWTNIWQGYVYLLANEKANIEKMQSTIDAIAHAENKTVENAVVKLRLQPLHEISLGIQNNNSLGETMDKKVVWVLIALSFIVILSACFNYTNLSIARSLKRAREVGVRKTIGASRGYVMTQFLTESVIISLVALVIAFGLFITLKPAFLSVNPSLQKMAQLELSLPLVGLFVLFAMVVGALAGFFPALFFSRMQSIHVLKGGLSAVSFKNVNLRKTLIVFQFTISLAFIVATLISYRQYEHFVNFDLGFNTNNIVNIRMQGNKPDLLIKELNELPEAEVISRSRMIPGVGTYFFAQLKHKNPLDSIEIQFNAVDENYIPLHDYKLVAGQNFHSKREENESEVIITENLLPYLNIDTTAASLALGETIKLNGRELTVIGVLKDYYYGSASDDKRKVALRYIGERTSYVNVRLSSTDWIGTIQKIEHIWKTIDPVHPVEAEFYSDQIKGKFQEMLTTFKIVGFLATLAICIAGMGLFGMVIFTTETRLKEISIRKTLGASYAQLIFLLSKNFMMLLGIAVVIAVPSTYYFFDQVILLSMKNHAPIYLPDIILGIVAVLGVAIVMISAQALKASLANPSEVLKSE